MNKQISGLNRINVLWGPVVVGYSLIHMFTIPQAWGYWSINDSGLFSILTICLVTAALLLLIVIITRTKRPSVKVSLIVLCYVMLIYILREADFHRLFTDEHVTKMKFYTNSSISLFQRVVGASAMGLFIASLLFLFFRYGLLFLRRLFDAQPWAVATVLWAILLIASQVVDKSSLTEVYLGRVVEEMLEFCASGYCFIAVYFSRRLLMRPESSV